MQMAGPQTKYYQAGGSLPANFPSYVFRPADDELFHYLSSGEFCYILTDRQMGKSSLKVMTIYRLGQLGWKCADIDITRFGSKGSTAEQWYYSFMLEIAIQLEFEDEFEDWWEANEKITFVARMSKFWEEILLPNTLGPIGIFIDEIDSMLSLDKDSFSTDDFFASLRATYNKRSNVKDLQRIHFCILGVATASDLMEDPSRTPFNIGNPIRLENLNLEIAKPLMKGLSAFENPAEVLKEIISWTGGQPYLTQKLCQLMNQSPQKGKDFREELNSIIHENFLNPRALNQDSKISDVNKRVLENEDWNLKMLSCYQQIRLSGFIKVDNRRLEQLYLKLSGLVREQNELLVINNRIYEHIFDDEWLQRGFDRIKRPYAEDIRRWLENNKSNDTLLKGTVLEEALKWKTNRDDLTKEEQDFIEASQVDQVRTNERGRQLTRLRWALAGVFTLLVVSVVALFIAYNQAAEITDKNLVLQSNQVELQQRQTDLASQLVKVYEEENTRHSFGINEMEGILARSTGRFTSSIETLKDSISFLEKEIESNLVLIDSIKNANDL